MKTPQWIAPSLASLSHGNIRLDCEPELIRAIWKARNLDELAAVYPAADGTIIPTCGPLPKLRQAKREAVDRAAGFYGVEYLGWHKRNREHVYYANAGDTYAATLIFQGRRMLVGCWGDMVERRLIEASR